jgi:hypothetical protein
MLNENQKIPADSMYYVYVLIDPRNDQPFYVGKGKGDRVLQHYYEWECIDQHNRNKALKIKTLKQLGYEPKYKIVFESSDAKLVFEEESRLIVKWGRGKYDKGGILTNIRLGEGPINEPGMAVDQYNLYGEFIQTFSSIKSAARILGNKCASSISKCCSKHGSQKAAYGFFWTYHGVPLDKEWCWAKKRPVYRWTLDGKFIDRYISATQAVEQLNLHSFKPSILNCLCKGAGRKRRHYQSAGFIWTHEPIFFSEYKPSTRKVMCLNDNETFNSLTEAAKFYGACRSSIIKVCKKKLKTTNNGLRFAYIDEQIYFLPELPKPALPRSS